MDMWRCESDVEYWDSLAGSDEAIQRLAEDEPPPLPLEARAAPDVAARMLENLTDDGDEERA